jgi:hypothetical protein
VINVWDVVRFMECGKRPGMSGLRAFSRGDGDDVAQ